jgi:PAS domain S-box-containing protein
MTTPPAEEHAPFRYSRLLPEESLRSLDTERLAERLRGLQLVTDAALVELSLPELLSTLLERIRSVLRTDSASVLLCSADGRSLEVRATLGLDEALHTTARVPLGSGVSGRVALERRAVIVDDVGAAEVVGPALARLRAMMAAPLLAEGTLIGVLHVGSFSPRRFEQDELEVLQAGADRMALALRNAFLYERLRQELEERRRLEARQSADEARFRLMVDSIQDYAILLLDAQGRVTSWNRGAEQIKGYAAEEILGQHVSIFYPPEERGGGGPEREMEVAARQGRWRDEGWRVRKDGTRFWASVVLSAVRDERDDLVGFTKVTRDLTDRHLAEQARERALMRERETRDAAEAANRVKTDFLAVMSHELRTPLSAIMGYADLLLAGIPEPIGESTRTQVERIDASARALLRIIEEILDYVNLEAGEAPLRLRKVDLRSAAREVVERVRPLAAEKGLVLSLTLPDEPLQARSEPVRVQQVLLQLLSNAVKFTARGTVHLEGVATDGCVEFRILDTGIGIAADHLERIFEPFWQVEQSSTRSYGGTGMGLAVARRTAELLRGTLGVSSRVGEGTTLTFRLPAAD